MEAAGYTETFIKFTIPLCSYKTASNLGKRNLFFLVFIITMLHVSA
jgi:hypothetical protein